MRQISLHSPTLTASLDIHKLELKNVLLSLRAKTNSRLLTIHPTQIGVEVN